MASLCLADAQKEKFSKNPPKLYRIKTRKPKPFRKRSDLKSYLSRESLSYNIIDLCVYLGSMTILELMCLYLLSAVFHHSESIQYKVHSGLVR